MKKKKYCRAMRGTKNHTFYPKKTEIKGPVTNYGVGGGHDFVEIMGA